MVELVNILSILMTFLKVITFVSCFLLLIKSSQNLKIKKLIMAGASGLGVMTLPLRGRGRRFKSGLAHLFAK